MDDEAMKAMARRIYAQFIIDNVPGAGPDDVPQFDDNAHGVKIALAAIIETREACARIADWGHMVPPDGGSPTDDERIVAESIAAAIRSGQQFRKDV